MSSDKLRTAIAVGLAAQLGAAGSALANGPAPGGASVEELRRIIAEQQRQLEDQQRMLDVLKDQVEEIGRRTVAAPDVPQRVVTSGQDRVKLSVSGQVNRGLLYADDGEQGEWFHVDNDNSSTRVRLIGTGQVTDDLSVGTQIEVQFESNSSSEVNQDNKRNVGPNSFTERKLELFVDSRRFGRLSVGQGDTASNGSSEVDLSAVDVIGYATLPDFAGGLLFRDEDSGELTTTSIGNVFSSFDGLSRDDRLRYDTPSLAGFKGSASWVADDRWDVALRYAGDFGPVKGAAAIAYSDPNGSVDNTLNGSFSVLHESGVNLTFASGRQDVAGRDPFFWYLKLGYIAKLTPYGDTAFGVDFTQADDVAQDGDEGTAYGFFAVQNLKEYGTEFYLGVRHHELDRDDAELDDIIAVLTGARVKF